MGKPIAGQNQFPYAVGGFLVDGAKINGVTYAKKLYIYKQRSYDIYDLQDTQGNIYRFIRLGYRDNLGNPLNYFDVAEEMVETIPDNTFFLKIQDPSRNIFSFVRIYQWHKCITVEGDYVYRTSDIDPRLSGVLINPAISTIQVGSTLSYKSLFYPATYPDTDGSWYMNSLDGLEDNKNASIVSTNLNTAIVKGDSVGKAVLTFVPERNDALVTHSIVNVVQEDLEIELFKIFNTDSYDAYLYDSEYTLEVVTYPYDAVIDSPLNIKIDSMSYYGAETTLVSTSEDNKKYTFVTTYTGRDEDKGYAMEYPTFTFTMSSPIEYEFVYSGIMISGIDNYKGSYNEVGIRFNIPPKLRPNMTYTAERYDQSPNKSVYPYISSDPDIATFDSSTGIVTTGNKKGKVTFSTQYMSYDNVLVTVDEINSIEVMDEVYDRVIREPAQITEINPGQSIQYTFTGYREGYEPVEIPMWPSLYPNYYTVSEDNVVTALPTAPINSRVYAWTYKDLNVDTQVLNIYRSSGTSYLVREPNTKVPMTSMYTTTDYDNRTLFVKYGELGNILVYQQPDICTNYQMEFEYYDDSVIEIVDKEYLLDSYQYAMNGTLYMFFETLKRGSTEMIVRSVHYPDVKVTMKIIVY